jgi:hypothetical protein
MIVLAKSQTSLVQVLIAHTNIVGTNINLEPLQHFMPDNIGTLSCTQLTQFQKQSHSLEEIRRVLDADQQREVWSEHQQSEDSCPKEQLEYACNFVIREHILISHPSVTTCPLGSWPQR